MPWSPEHPHNDLPGLPPDVELETAPVLRALIAARAELAGLEESLSALPNPQVFIHSLALLEAQASSEIENIVTTTDELFRAETLAAEASPATREAMRYRQALFAGLELMRRREGLITASTAAAICTQIRGVSTEVRADQGTFIGNPSTQKRIYTPPEGESVIREKLDDWTAFVNGADGLDLDPLVRIAVAHYQFEAIHPYPDGNGRTGRILNVLQLVASGLLSRPVLYVSRAIIERKGSYYRLLNQVTEQGAWEEWILFMIEAFRSTASSTRGKIKRIQEHQLHLSDSIRALLGVHVPATFAEVLFEQPYCRIADVMTRCEVSRPTATKYLATLQGAGQLAVEQAGREKLYVNTGFLEILRGV
ncbi:addiction module protein [Rothia kristinae]|uniref:Addiction module protein n=1 Tax=Rothia kristinae TaxID=37923 RepID=A0A199NRE7_9MICC|nr:Fic/DOC family N-terminal domain-containing protein [Rothia kristinae]OAX51669.1 addiction module protein [Rothia kristinae]OAX56634.1 addiction module protein [Rothia kristinae]